jgi:hypothetical protein
MHGGARRRATPTPPVVTTSGKYFVCFGSRADSCTRECHRRATGDVQCICIYLSTPNSSRKVITTLFLFFNLYFTVHFIRKSTQQNKERMEELTGTRFSCHGRVDICVVNLDLVSAGGIGGTRSIMSSRLTW